MVEARHWRLGAGSRFLLKLLALKGIRILYVRLRVVWYVRVRKRLRTLESGDSAPRTVEHNLRSLMMVSERAGRLIRAAALVEDVGAGATLIIGCRNEDDLYVAEIAGYQNVIGMDLISYSPRVHLGDMHNIPFEDSTFDCVIVPYTISYSSNIRLAMSEIVRVARDGAVIAISVEYAKLPLDQSAVGNLIVPGDGYEVRSTAQIIELLGAAVDSVIVNYDGLKKRSHSDSGLIQDVSPVDLVVTISKPAVPLDVSL